VLNKGFILPDTIPTSLGTWIAIGGSSLLTGILGWWTSNRLAKANIRKIDVETKLALSKAEAESNQTEANRSVDFEKALNERASRLLDSLEKQITDLTEIVTAQNKRLEDQSHQIQEMESEIRSLRVALDGRTQELHSITLKHANRT
jgi:TolA-binding protein